MPHKKVKGIDDEAHCADDNESDFESDDDKIQNESFIDDEDEFSCASMEDKANDLPAPATVKKRGRPSGTTKVTSQSFKAPGDSAYPVNDFSLTITKTKDDVGLDALDNIAKFIEEHCIKGGVSTEVGHRVFQLHLQGIFRIHWPSNKEYTQRLQKLLKTLLPAQGKQYRVLVKAFMKNQNFSAMVGYITKDQGNIMNHDYITCILLIIL